MCKPVGPVGSSVIFADLGVARPGQNIYTFNLFTGAPKHQLNLE